MSLPVLDSGEMVRGYYESSDSQASQIERLQSALDYESTGRHLTVLKTMSAIARGLHVAGFVLRPDDGISEVSIVANGNAREISPAEFQWLMHDSAGRSILLDGPMQRGALQGALRAADDLLSKNMEQQAVIRSLRANAREDAKTAQNVRESLQELRDDFAFHCVHASSSAYQVLDKLDAVISSLKQ